MQDIFLTKYYIISLLFSFLHYKISCSFNAKHNRTLLIPDNQIIQEIQPHEIYVYQFEVIFQLNYFSMTAIQGNPLLYGYYTTNISNFAMTETDIPQYLSVGLLIESKKIQMFSNLEIRVIFKNNLEREQFIALVYCPSSIPCKYSLILFYPREPKNTIFPTYPFSIYGLYDHSPLESQYLRIPLSDYPNTSNITVSVYYTTYTGYVDLVSCTQNDVEIRTKRHFNGARENIIINCQGGYDLILHLNPLENSYFIVNYEINKEDSKTFLINEDIIEMHEIKLNEKHSYIVERSLFYEGVNIIFNIKAENCLLKILDLSEDVEIYSEYPNYYQLVFKKEDEYKVTVENNRFDDIDNTNPNVSCRYYTYAVENENTNSVLLLEGATIQTKLNATENKIILFTFPFLFDYSIRYSCFIIDFELSEKSTLYFQLSFDKAQQVSNEIKYLNKSTSFFLSYNKFSNICVYDTICTIGIELGTKTDLVANITLRTKQYTPYYLRKNVIFYDQIFTYYERNFYVDVKNGDKGIVQIDYLSQGLDYVNYTIIENNDSKSKKDINSVEWYGTDYLLGKGYFNISQPCLNGCKLYIKLVSAHILSQITQYETMQYNIIIKLNDNMISSPLYETVRGTIDNINSNNRYLFKLPREISYFQIKIKGKGIKFVIKDLNEQLPCCENINKEYIPNTDTLFIIFIIYQNISTIDYNLQIEVDVSPINEISDYLYYEMSVSPDEHLAHPLYIIKGDTEVECYTGNETNKIYILYERNRFEPLLPYLIYAFNPDNENDKIKITVNILQFQIYDTIPYRGWEPYFIDKGEQIYQSKEGHSYLELQPTEESNVAFFILIESQSINTQLNILLKKENVFYPFFIIPFSFNIQLLEQQKVSSVYLLGKYNNRFNKNELYEITIQKIKGIGSVYVEDKFPLEGKTSFILKGNQVKALSRIHIFSDNLGYLIKLDKLDNNKIHYINLNNITSFHYYLNSFPLYYSLHLSKDILSLHLVIEMIYTDFKNNINYPFSNLEFKCYLSNKKSINSFEEHNHTLTEKENIDIKTIIGKPIIIIDVFKNDNFDYLFIEIKEKKPYYSFNKIILQFLPLYTTKSSNIQILTPKKYHYIELKEETSLILSSTNNDKMRIEYSSCSFDNIQYSLSYYTSKNPINIISDNVEYGKHIIEVELTSNEDYIVLTLFSNKTITCIVKYSVIPQKNNFMNFYTERLIQYNFEPFEKSISVNWTSIKNLTNLYSRVSALYFFTLYENNMNTHYSICSNNSFYDSKLVNNEIIQLSTTSFSSDIYDIVVIGYFLNNNDEEFLIMYDPIKINVGSSGYLVIWIIALFVGLLLIIVYSTYRLYKEIRKRQDEDDINSSLEIIT